MAPERAGRRLLAALAGSTPAFTPVPVSDGHTRARRLLSALAGSTPAFSGGAPPGQDADGPNLYADPDDVVAELMAFAAMMATRAPADRLAARIWLPEEGLRHIQSLGDTDWSEYLDPTFRDVERLRRYRDTAYRIKFVVQHFYVRADERAVAGSSADADKLEAALTAMGEVAFAFERTFGDELRRLEISAHRRAGRGVGLVRRTRRRVRVETLFVAMARVTSRLIVAVDQLLAAVTDLTGADLADADLEQVPLDGVQWSSATRWPVEWDGWVRENSVRVAADVYVIRAGQVDTDSPITVR